MESAEIAQPTSEVDYFKSVLDTIAKDGGFDTFEGILSNLSREQGFGNQRAIFSDLFLGFNRRQQGNMTPANSDRQGLTFFTRPDLNLSYDNVAGVRKLTQFLSLKDDTYQRAIRVMLYPEGHMSGGNVVAPGIFDERQAFITLLSNTLTTMSGWPDMTLNVYNTPEGMAKETWIMNDSREEIYSRLDLSCTFRNVLGDPVTALFFLWLVYIGAVYTDRMVPLKKNLIEGRIDYQTRVYRFVMDHQNRYIQKAAMTGASMPYGLNIGSAFNLDRESVFNENLNDININLASVGAIYNDPIIFQQFNRTVATFNRQMATSRNGRELIKIPPDQMLMMNYRGYPWVNMKTSEMEWWATPEMIRDVAAGK